MRIELNGADRVSVPTTTAAADNRAVQPASPAAPPADGVSLSGAAQELRAYQRAAQLLQPIEETRTLGGRSLLLGC